MSVIKSLELDPTVQLLAADMDAWAAGLYLLPPDARTLIPAGLDPDFASAVLARCAALGVHVLIPTVDAEMRPLARARAEYAAAGIELMLAPERALDLTLDKLALARCCAGHVRVPRTECFDDALDPASWDYPVVLKPRTGSGSRDISVVASARDLAALERSAEFIVQEYLPGEEYSIDVLADTSSHVIAAVPRVRARVDSGVSVAGRTMHDPELEHFGATVASVTGLTYIANVQARRDVAGRAGPARGEPAGARGAPADHGQRRGHAEAGPGRAARPPRPGARGLPRDGHGPLPRGALHGPERSAEGRRVTHLPGREPAACGPPAWWRSTRTTTSTRPSPTTR